MYNPYRIAFHQPSGLKKRVKAFLRTSIVYHSDGTKTVTKGSKYVEDKRQSKKNS